MGKTCYRAHLAALFFLVIGGCAQKESAPQPQVQVEAVEIPVPNRAERRTVSLAKPKAAPLPPTPIETSPPATTPPIRTEVLTVAAPVPVPIVPRVEPPKVFSQPRFVITPPVRYETPNNLSEIESGALAWAQGDSAGASRWFQQAAEQGDSEAQLNVGIMFTYGEGVEQDYGAALKYFELALAQKNLSAEKIAMLRDTAREINRAALLELQKAQVQQRISEIQKAYAPERNSGSTILSVRYQAAQRSGGAALFQSHVDVSGALMQALRRE